MAATKDGAELVMYSRLQKTRIRALQHSVPELEQPSHGLEEKLIDLLPVVRNNVYHPAFKGSFSIRYVLPALVPDLSYDDLVIVNEMETSVEIARLLFVAVDSC